jgi:hypothetical protein
MKRWESFFLGLCGLRLLDLPSVVSTCVFEIIQSDCNEIDERICTLYSILNGKSKFAMCRKRQEKKQNQNVYLHQGIP